MSTSKYIRQIALPLVGEAGQHQLKKAKVLVVGAGGLGNAILPYLAASGIGTIGIIDGDTVALSNLHRQILFSETDINQPKAITARNKLKAQFPEITFLAYDAFLTGDNALELFASYDIIVDATDAIEMRYLINDACILTETPFVHASVYRFQFQVVVFNVNGSGTYRCLYAQPPQTVQSCEEAGVMPTTVAMAGLYQANEVFKYLLNVGQLLINKMLLVDTLTNKQHVFTFSKNDTTQITKTFFNITYKEHIIEYISFNEALKLGGLFLDVRDPSETPKLQLDNYVQISLQDLANNLDQLSGAKRIFICCQSGKRSALAVKLLKKNAFKTVYQLSDNAPEINKMTHK